LTGLERAAPVVRSHHERWDGAGYPDGLKGEAIPVLSRVIAACDAFVAMAIDRPHRRGAGGEVALEHVERERGEQLDPQVVDALVTVIGGDRGDDDAPRPETRPDVRRVDGPGAERAGPDLTEILARLDVLPAFGPAIDRLLEAAPAGADVVKRDSNAAVESDIGLTVAMLRAGQVASRRRVTSISDAVSALTPEQIRAAVDALPRAAFPWRAPLEAFMHHARVHAQAVSRAAQRIARELELKSVDELIVVALLHDVGKLVLGHARGGVLNAPDTRTATPETRIQHERRATGLDHPSLGALLLRRWKLPDRLSDAVARHHQAEEGRDLATLVRLADMVAHHAHGDAVDRALMLRVAEACRLPVTALRDALFDLPHSGGSERRRAEPSPLSTRETAIVRRLAEGKLYKEIARDLGLSNSTVRTHLHNAYSKLQVADRAQAVLLATEMGWI
jgi:putative nucleotidyltransferase with HDIG domain